MYSGIDVSKHNGRLDWERVRNNNNVNFAIIRVGVGNDICCQDDAQAVRNMNECEKLGIPYGVYLFSYAMNYCEAESEAEHALRMVKGRQPALGIWYDIEDAPGYREYSKVSYISENVRDGLTNFCRIFCNKVREEGFRSGVYANLDYFNRILYRDKLVESGCGIWLAHWGAENPDFECDLWQYSSSGKIDGSSVNTDMNYYFGNL